MCFPPTYYLTFPSLLTLLSTDFPNVRKSETNSETRVKCEKKKIKTNLDLHPGTNISNISDQRNFSDKNLRIFNFCPTSTSLKVQPHHSTHTTHPGMSSTPLRFSPPLLSSTPLPFSPPLPSCVLENALTARSVEDVGISVVGKR